MPESAVTETRTFTVECRRTITDRCRGWDEEEGDDVRSISAAEAALRDSGWRLHGDATASCPECIDAWENGIDRPIDAPDVKRDPEEVPDPNEWEAAQAEALRTEVEGDGGVGEAMAAS